MKDKPRIYFLIGAPSTGRTTFRKHLIKFHGFRGFREISVDDALLRIAAQQSCSLADIQDSVREETQQDLLKRYRIALAQRLNIVVDVDDLLTKEERARWLEGIPADYVKLAFVFEPPNDHRDRNAHRKDYAVDWAKVEEAVTRLVPPSPDEGFDDIVKRKM